MQSSKFCHCQFPLTKNILKKNFRKHLFFFLFSRNVPETLQVEPVYTFKSQTSLSDKHLYSDVVMIFADVLSMSEIKHGCTHAITSYENMFWIIYTICVPIHIGTVKNRPDNLMCHRASKNVSSESKQFTALVIMQLGAWLKNQNCQKNSNINRTFRFIKSPKLWSRVELNM